MRTLILAAAWKGTIVLAAGWLASLALRRASAATRHLVWCAALAGLLLLPVLLAVVPWWTVPAPGPLVSQTALVVRAAAPLRGPTTAPAAVDPVVGGWVIGAMAVAAWFLAGAWRLVRTERSSRVLVEAQVPVRVGQSDRIRVPLVWGLWRPVILLPAEASQWESEHRRMVLLHEMGHVVRRDGWTQALAQLACVLYWFHPLVWLAAARMRQEREQACDDRVLAAGVKASDYAGRLLEMAGSLRLREPLPGAVAMAQRSGFEGRLLAILDENRRRGDLSRRTAAAVAVAVVALLVPLAALRAAPGTRSVVGTVYDISGGVIPDLDVILLDAASGQNATVKTGPAGEFGFPAVAPGRYQLTVAGPGFRQHMQTLAVPDAAQPVRVDVVLQPGEVRETMEVRAAGRPTPATRPRRVRVGGNLRRPQLVFGQPPSYPERARANGLEGDVLIRTVILAEGLTAEPVVLNSPDPELSKAALDAVRQWRYQPTLLNGVAVEAVTTITISFRLDEP